MRTVEEVKKMIDMEWIYDYAFPYVHVKKLKKSTKLLLIRAKVPKDDYTTLFSFPAAGLVYNKAIAEGWSVTDLQGNNANRYNVTTKINNDDPDFIIHYDHGSSYTMWGQKNNASEGVLDTHNVSLLSSRAASSVACLTAGGLGPVAVSTSTKAYLGYDALHWIVTGPYLSYFTKAANAANYALLEGKTFQEAFDIGYAEYTTQFWNLVALGDWYSVGFASQFMLHDRLHFKLLGDGTAVAWRWK